MDVVDQRVGRELPVAEIGERGLALDLEAVVARVRLAHLIDRQPVLDRAGRGLVDEVVEPGVVERGLQAVARPAAAQDRLDADRAFLGQARIADLEGLGSGVRAVGEQFFRRRRALGARDVHAELPPRREGIGAAGREREGVEAARAVKELRLRGVGHGIGRGVLEPGAGFELEGTGLKLLEGEEPDLARRVARQESLVADHVEVADGELGAGHALPPAVLGLGDLEPAFHALVVEGRADRAVLLQLEVLVVGIAEAQADLVDHAAVRRDLGLGVDAVLAELETRRFLLLPDLGREADRHTVEAVVVAVGHADRAAVADVGRADGGGPGPRGGVGQRTLDRGVLGEVDFRIGIGQQAGGQRIGPQRRGQGIAADADVVGLVVAAVGMEHPAPAEPHVGRARQRPLVRRRAIASQGRQVHGLVGHGVGNAAVDHVDHPADGRGAVEQRLRTAQHLDPLGQQRIDHRRVIDRGVGDVDRADPVGQDPHALALQAAQDRAGGRGAERAGGHARSAGQGVADRRAQRRGQLLALEHGDARQRVLARDGQRRGDDDVLGRTLVIVVLGVIVGRRLIGEGGRGGQGQDRRDGTGTAGFVESHVGSLRLQLFVAGASIQIFEMIQHYIYEMSVPCRALPPDWRTPACSGKTEATRYLLQNP